MSEPEDYADKRDVLLLEHAFSLMILHAEMAIHRELLVASQPTPAINETVIHTMVAQRMDRILAEAADYGPNQIRFFSTLFEEWKKAKNISI